MYVPAQHQGCALSHTSSSAPMSVEHIPLGRMIRYSFVTDDCHRYTESAIPQTTPPPTVVRIRDGSDRTSG